MNLYNFYHLEYFGLMYSSSLLYSQLICPSDFFRCFILNLGTYTEPQIEPFIQPTVVNCSNSINHDRVQLLSYCKYSLLFLPAVGIEPATSR